MRYLWLTLLLVGCGKGSTAVSPPPPPTLLADTVHVELINQSPWSDVIRGYHSSGTIGPSTTRCFGFVAQYQQGDVNPHSTLRALSVLNDLITVNGNPGHTILDTSIVFTSSPGWRIVSPDANTATLSQVSNPCVP